MNPASLAFLNLGGQEMMVIFLVILLLFGAKKLPELARGVGKSMGEFKRARDEFEREITRHEEDARTPVAATAAAATTRVVTSEQDRERDLAKREEELRAREAAISVREASGKEPREHA